MVNWSLSTPWKLIEAVEVWFRSFVKLTLDGTDWSASCSSCFNLRGKSPPPHNTHWLGVWMGPRAGLHILENRKSIAFARIRTPDLPARSLVPIPTELSCLHFLIYTATDSLVCVVWRHWGRNLAWGCLRTGCWGEYLGQRGSRRQWSEENYIIRILMICTAHPIFFGW